MKLPRPKGNQRLDSDRGERYVPGTVVAERYRIVALLGRGGMGEVFRADDLKLGQPVALKFLPSRVAHDSSRLELLLEEVRVARRVSHPNVCRVYDVGEADGRHFISMEYMDGEDLATLLRRIGRLPRDKAAQIARQICAGLAAAHEQDVVHRDLKPANVMIDGRGRARITDFGLAREAEAISGGDAREGTPAYMAPEQLAGREVSARSDIYALGLVLYELFTGHQPFEARSRAEALDERSSGPPTRPSSLVENLDPAVEGAILRCLEPEPDVRPVSALAVAAALPGGDLLAASLAAGETPSPEMVAAAPTEGTVHPWLAASAVAFCLLAVLGGLALEFDQVLGLSGRPPIVLADRARQILTELGYSSSAGDEAWGYVRDSQVVDRMRERPADVASLLDGGGPPLFAFWYRASPSTLMPNFFHRVARNDPPRNTPGSSMVTLDTDGRLVGLEVEPSDVSDSARAVEGSALGDGLLELAGLDPSALRQVEPQSLPPHFADERTAWVGRYPSDLELRAEAAATAGRASWLRVYSPELGEGRPRSGEVPAVFGALLFLLFALIVAAGTWLARANLRSGRGDRRGAFRLGLLIGSTTFLAWVVGATHGLAFEEVLNLFRVAAFSLLLGVLTALFYIGLEPALRRRWPHRIVSWTRALDGQLRDPLVGRDLLVGATATTLFLFLPVIWWELGTLLGVEQPALVALEFKPAAWGVPGVAGVWLSSLTGSIHMPLGFMLLLFAMTRVLRKEWLAATLFCALMTFGACLRDGATEPFQVVALLLPWVVAVVVMLRFGVLPTVALFSLAHLGILYPVTGFSGAWWAGGRMTLLATIVVVAAYGAWCCARRPAPTRE